MRVLLVEDDAMIGESVKVALRQEGFTVDWVRDGDAGLDAASDQHGPRADGGYDVVLLDLGLPRRPGLDVLKTLRARNVRTLVLILTARDAVADRVAGLNAGADDYLIKPFDVAELKARLRALLRRSFQRPQPALEYRGISLDPASQVVEYQGQTINLPRKEFLLLHELRSSLVVC